MDENLVIEQDEAIEVNFDMVNQEVQDITKEVNLLNFSDLTKT